MHITAYGAVAASGQVKVQLKPGQKLTRVFVHCERDATGPGDPKVACAPGTRRQLEGGFWTWANATFAITDAAISKPAAAKLVAQLAEGVVDVGPTTIAVIDLVEWTMTDEVVARGCEHAQGHPCDPIAVRTGKRIRTREGQLFAAIGGLGLPLDFTYVSGLLEMLGSGLWSGSFALLIPFETAHQDKVLDVYNNPVHAPQALAYLATADDTDPDVRIALAYDRVVIAAYARDATAFAAARAQLGAAPAKHAPGAATKDAIDAARPQLDLFASGKLAFTPPAGLAPFLVR